MSVVIPVYERLSTLQEALSSVFAQKFKPFEVIVIDDGSSIDISAGLSEYLTKIKFIKFDKNLGVSAARNTGIDLANGDYIAFLDSDDLWTDNKLECQITFMDTYNFKASHTNEHWLRGNKYLKQVDSFKRYGGRVFTNVLDKCRVSPSTLIVHKDVFNDVGLFSESLRVCEDYEFTLRLALKYELGYLNEKLTIKRAITDDQLSVNIEHIESIRLNILENFNEQMNEDELAAFNEELKRKRSIVKLPH